MRLWILCFFFMSFYAMADSAHRMQGLYRLPNQQRPIEYTLEWKEMKGQIQGEYKDNYYAPSAKVKGSVGERGRSFTVMLNEEIHGVKTIHLLTSKDRSGQDITLPVSIVVRDAKGTPLSTAISDAKLGYQQRPIQAQESKECQEGFGELAGFCGNYRGIVSEDQDKTNGCDLVATGIPVLELAKTGEVAIHLGNNPSVVVEPMHSVGRVPANYGSSDIDVMSRACRPLAGVEFGGDNCKLLNVRGNFSRIERGNHFGGTYTIRDEKTNRQCVYQLSLDMQT